MLKLSKSRIGQSAMVGTVLLIMMAIVAGVLVSSFSQKSTKKVSDKIIEIGTSVDCIDIRLSLKIDDSDITILNRGTLGVDKVVLRKFFETNIEIRELDEFDGKKKLLPGKDDQGNRIEYVYSLSNFDDSSYDRIEAKPVFLNEEGDLIGCNTVSYVKEG